MKKFWSVLLCLLLTISLALSLCACEEPVQDPASGNSEPSEPSDPSDPSDPSETESLLTDTWRWNLNLARLYNAALNRYDLEILHIDKFTYPVTLELHEDGTARLYLDQTAALNEYQWIRSMLEQALISFVPDAFEMSLETFLQSKNTTLNALIDSVMTPLLPNALDIGFTGYYKVVDNRLYMSEDTEFTEDEACPFTLDGDRLLIENEGSAPFAPMDFSRYIDDIE